MADIAPKDRLQPALLDRLNDNLGGIERRLQRERERLLPQLDDARRAALAGLADIEERGLRPPSAEELQPFAPLDKTLRDAVERVLRLEQQRFLELRQHHVISLDRLKECVMRDLRWLFNSDFLASRQPLDDYPNVRTSVVNFGIPPLAGTTLNALQAEPLERLVRDAVRAFEPRLRRDSVKVKVTFEGESMNANSLLLLIEGELWGDPLPLRLFLQTIINLEDGSAEVREAVA